jgi:hypothetical protein
MTADGVQAAKLLGINLLDHIVIGQGRFVSLKERGVFSRVAGRLENVYKGSRTESLSGAIWTNTNRLRHVHSRESSVTRLAGRLRSTW